MKTPHRILIAVLALTAGCADAGPDIGAVRREIDAYRARWEADRPANYVYEVERQCYCLETARGPVRVRVSGSTVVERTYADSGESVPDDLADLFPSVDGLFDVLEDAADRNAASIRLTWPIEGGVPVEFFIDYDEMIADEELGFRVLSLPEPVAGV